MAGNFQWHGDALQARLRDELGRRLSASAILLTNHAKRLISVDGTGSTGPGRDAATGRFTKGNLDYGANPSAPGDPPHLQTGYLRDNVMWEVAGLVARVGTNVIYGRFLELGTATMQPRPWLRRSLLECKQKIERILGAPWS